MFAPSRDEVRGFFLAAWQDFQAGRTLDGNRQVAARIVAEHPEYHPLLAQGNAATAREFTPEGGQTNPFLHLSLHLAVEEQLAIDQPPGIRACYLTLLGRRGNEHDAQHDVLECLGEVLWKAQREGTPPDGEAYLVCLRRRITNGP